MLPQTSGAKAKEFDLKVSRWERGGGGDAMKKRRKLLKVPAGNFQHRYTILKGRSTLLLILRSSIFCRSPFWLISWMRQHGCMMHIMTLEDGYNSLPACCSLTGHTASAHHEHIWCSLLLNNRDTISCVSTSLCLRSSVRTVED